MCKVLTKLTTILYHVVRSLTHHVYTHQMLTITLAVVQGVNLSFPVSSRQQSAMVEIATGDLRCGMESVKLKDNTA